MHKQMRVRLTHARELLQRNMDTSRQMLAHLDVCENCTDDQLCPPGQELHDKFELASARARFLVGE